MGMAAAQSVNWKRSGAVTEKSTDPSNATMQTPTTMTHVKIIVPLEITGFAEMELWILAKAVKMAVI